MFSLDHAIADWRRQMRAAGIKTPEPLDEWEAHLRGAVEQQMQLGLNAQQAFAVAVQRVGQARVLKAKFAKGGEAGRVAWWKRDLISPLGERRLNLLALGVVGVLYLAAAAFGLFKSGNQMSSAERMLGFAAVALTVLLAASWRFAYRFLPVFPNQRTRMAVEVACMLLAIAWLVVFIRLILPRFDFTVSQLVVIVLWAITPMAGFVSFAYGLEEAAGKQTVTAGSLTSQS
jgi:hypothetical protein